MRKCGRNHCAWRSLTKFLKLCSSSKIGSTTSPLLCGPISGHDTCESGDIASDDGSCEPGEVGSEGGSIEVEGPALEYDGIEGNPAIVAEEAEPSVTTAAATGFTDDSDDVGYVYTCPGDKQV